MDGGKNRRCLGRPFRLSRLVSCSSLHGAATLRGHLCKLRVHDSAFRRIIRPVCRASRSDQRYAQSCF
jgi:hypothetical protein